MLMLKGISVEQNYFACIPPKRKLDTLLQLSGCSSTWKCPLGNEELKTIKMWSMVKINFSPCQQASLWLLLIKLNQDELNGNVFQLCTFSCSAVKIYSKGKTNEQANPWLHSRIIWKALLMCPPKRFWLSWLGVTKVVPMHSQGWESLTILDQSLMSRIWMEHHL